MNIIETKNLTYSYDGGKNALNNMSIAFERGKITSVLGSNGAGKSTLFLNLNGVLTPDSGEVFFKGERVIYKKKEIRKLREKIGIVFQDPDDQLFSASVYDDIAFGAVNLGLPHEEVTRRVNEAMDRVGITALKDSPTHEMSFGQKKRAAIAGVLAMKPEVIILDEPTAGLDPMGVSALMRLICDIRDTEGTTFIMSTHDIDVVPIYSDYIYVINGGEVKASGSSEEIFSDPECLRKNDLRLPRISHLLEILNKRDGVGVDFSKSTIGSARKELLRHLKE